MAEDRSHHRYRYKNVPLHKKGGFDYIWESNTTSFSGSDTVVSFAFPDERAVTMGMVSDLSYSVLRPKFEVFTLGRISPKAYTLGPRTIAGTIVFTVLGEHPMIWMKEKIGYLAKYKKLKMDELPTFDIIITMANEYGDSAKMIIHGCTFEDESMEISTLNLYTEVVLRYRAKDIEYLRGNYEPEMWRQASSTVFDTAGNYDISPYFKMSDIIGEKEFQERKKMIEAIYNKITKAGVPTNIFPLSVQAKNYNYDSNPMLPDKKEDDYGLPKEPSTGGGSNNDPSIREIPPEDRCVNNSQAEIRTKIEIDKGFQGFLMLWRTNSTSTDGKKIGGSTADEWMRNLKANQYMGGWYINVTGDGNLKINLKEVPTGQYIILCFSYLQDDKNLLGKQFANIQLYSHVAGIRISHCGKHHVETPFLYDDYYIHKDGKQTKNKKAKQMWSTMGAPGGNDFRDFPYYRSGGLDGSITGKASQTKEFKITRGKTNTGSR